MNYSTYRFTLDIHQVRSQMSIPLFFQDTWVRFLINLTDGGKPYTLEEVAKATLFGKKADGTSLVEDCNIIENNTRIEYTFSEQTASALGPVECEIRLYSKSGRQLTSPSFTIVVEERVLRDEDIIESETEKSAIDRILDSEEAIKAAATKAEAEADRAEEAARSIIENGGGGGGSGKSAYEYAQEGGYQGTEEEFAVKMAEECPTKLSELENDEGFIDAKGAPVQSVNSRIGAVTLAAVDVGADPAGTASGAVGAHNTNNAAHNDIRLLIQGLSERINAALNSDDTTLDQLSEIVAYIKSNKALIDVVTTSKVNVSDIVNDLVTNIANKPLSAAQGVELKRLIDALESNKLAASALTSAIETALAEAKASGEFDGATFTPYVNALTGYLSWSNNKGLPNPSRIKIKGDDAFSPIVSVSKSDKVTTITIEDANGAKTATVNDGADGTSVSVSNVSESTASGGSNVVTFSDGEKVTVKNGKDGKDYVLSAADKQEIKNAVISSIVTQEAGQSDRLVMSQKTVTNLVEDALGSGGSTQYETVDSVDKMTDTSKQYVLSTTGTIWEHGETTVVVEPPNKFVPSTATLNQRLSGSSGSVSSNSTSVGSFVTDYIAVSGMESTPTYYARLNWEMASSDDNKVIYYNASKTRLSSNEFATSANNYVVSNGHTVLDLKSMYNGKTAPTWADVAYVRFQLFVKPIGTSITSTDIANLAITFDADGGTKTESAWYDTGLQPSASGGGGNYVALLKKVNENASDIKEISERVTAIEKDTETLTIPSYWEDAVDACIAKIKALQVGRNCITFPFFSDNHQRNGYAGMLIAHIMKECHIPYAFYGGDSISSGYIESEAVMIEQDKAFDTAMSYIPNGRFCRAVGNHDGYWAVSADEKHNYTDAQNYELFLREESVAQNKHFGGDGTYYYVDDIASKVRWIVLDTNDSTVESEQITWLQNTALSFTESGWAVVFISHQPISNHYHANISNAEAVRTVVKNYINGSATNKAAVVGWYSGHIHRDRIYTGVATNTEDDSQGSAMGFTQVTITSDHTGIAYDDATKHTVANDDQSHAIDFVTINKATRQVNLTRLGIGSDRSYTY